MEQVSTIVLPDKGKRTKTKVKEAKKKIEEEQKQKLSLVSKIARKGFFTTIKDYKNMYANQRYFEEPFVLRTDSGDAISIRKREWDSQDRQAWDQHGYIIHGEELCICNVHRRRTMYFKQLAKFTSDLGSTSFAVEKKIMYKNCPEFPL